MNTIYFRVCLSVCLGQISYSRRAERRRCKANIKSGHSPKFTQPIQPTSHGWPVIITKKTMTVHLLRIFETHPWLTLSCLLITHGLTPAAAISMILRRMWLGRGRPLMNTPPSWFIRPWPWSTCTVSCWVKTTSVSSTFCNVSNDKFHSLFPIKDDLGNPWIQNLMRP